MNNCLYCYRTLNNDETDYHTSCTRKFFGLSQAPVLPFNEDQLIAMAEQIIKNQIAVTGVQPKLSLELKKALKGEVPKFTLVGLWGDYILKPPNAQYQYMPETESLTMHMAKAAGINTVPFSLIRMRSGQLAYITKRIDRVKKGKLHMEDMCQLTERLTEDKYKGSYEQIGKAIMKYSVNPGLDLILFFEQVLFSFLTGNSDMHLKNFSLIKKQGMGYVLSDSYDMISSSLLLPDDPEEMALTINSRKNKITMRDFNAIAETFKLPSKTLERIFIKYRKVQASWAELISISFLPAEMKDQYFILINERLGRLNLPVMNSTGTK